MNILTLLTSTECFAKLNIYSPVDKSQQKSIQSSTLFVRYPSSQNFNSEKEKELAVIEKDNHEKHPRKNQAWDTIVSRNQEVYTKQVSEEIEVRLTKKLPESSVGHKVAFWAPCPSWMRILSTHKTGLTTDPFRRSPGIQMERTRKETKIVPRIILILKWASLLVSA